MEKKSFKKGINVLFGILVTCLMLATLCPAEEKLRVGTFDSRAIALAYGRSGEYMQYVASLKEKHKKAKEEGDEKLVKELEALGPADHNVMELQAFSIASVANILEKVKAKLPKIAMDASVDIIVSEWEVVYRNPSIEIVDVTSYLVKLFNPEDSTLKMVEELRKQTPVPLLELLLEMRKEK